jgi:hypothetical protein
VVRLALFTLLLPRLEDTTGVTAAVAVVVEVVATITPAAAVEAAGGKSAGVAAVRLLSAAVDI